MADYTIHKLSPGCEVFHYYIHARIREDYAIEFAAFEFIEDSSKITNEKITLAEITGAEQELVWQKKNCDHKPILRIATKAEAEKKLMSGGKLKFSACPQYAGYWVNQSNARYKHGIINKGVRCYGHIWSYWYAIINNVLYFVGLPLWQGDDSGSIVFGNSDTVKAIATPPTQYDLNHGKVPNNSFRQAMSLVQDITLWGGGSNTFNNPSNKTAGAARILEKYGTRSGETELVNLVLGKIEKDKESKKAKLTQYHRGDIIADMGARTGLGGVFCKEGEGLVEYSASDFWIHSENEGISYFSGSSCYIPQKTKDVPDDSGMTFVYFLTSYFVGNTLTIYCQGPRYIRSRVWDNSYDFTLDGEGPSPDTPDPDTPDPDGPTPNVPDPGPIGPTPNPPSPNPPQPVIPPSIIQIPNGGYIWRAVGKGIKIDGKVVKNTSPFIAVEVLYQISVTAKPKRKGTLNYPVTIEAEADGGGTYKLPREYGAGTTSTLTYGVSGDSDIKLTNATTYAGNRVETSGEFTKNVRIPWHAEATFGQCVKKSSENSLNSNIVTATVTNKTETIRMQLYTSMSKKPFEADVTFIVVEVRLNENAVNEIIKNNTIQKIGDSISGRITPSVVNGTAQKTKTKKPSIKARITESPSRHQSVTGLTQAVGEISMTPTNQRIDEGTATFTVSNGTTGWYEETITNRATASISGSFTVKTQARSL